MIQWSRIIRFFLIYNKYSSSLNYRIFRCNKLPNFGNLIVEKKCNFYLTIEIKNLFCMIPGQHPSI